MSDIDLVRLAPWLAQAVRGLSGITSLEKFPGGQSNPTYRIVTEAGDAVLRRKPFGVLLPSAHAIEREYRLLAALHPTGFAVPEPLALCEDADILGAPFYVMAMVTGRSFWNGALPEVARDQRRPLYDAMVDMLAALHGFVPDTLGLGDFGRPGNYFARQIARWTAQYRAAETEHIPEIERLIAWLPTTVPDQDRVAIIRGDYRIDNLVFAPEAPAVVAVLDWELATIGDPLADFSYFAMNWVMAAEGQAGLSGVDLLAEGLPALDDMVGRYCAATGRDRFLTEGDTLELGGHDFEVLHCPGHTPGHVVFVDRAGGLAIVGDVLFQGSVGRTDFPYGDTGALLQSIRDKLMPLPDETAFLCGHGPGSTIGIERKNNPYVHEAMRTANA